ncbi:sigma-70 family RNA polymerase sigma factor [Clostridium sp. PL3]|uniref:Sigma-70 family RNA polymerase sigma factor n=1 Tax=Clostridium thailandense TaxID=2794346 RepID=A0A949U1M4_9CLOT|nr:sigma-70 family RNA polymerase sigma factor [Clostridium thailandense]MBV7275710.1 sigma-70 family RNA polymerase sigma factor [Clostridium thailandense]
MQKLIICQKNTLYTIREEGIKINKLDLIETIKEAQAGNSRALEYILNKCKPLIMKSSLEIYIDGYETQDLAQIASIALIKAVNKYDCSRSPGFIAYAKKIIKNALNDELRRFLNKRNDKKFKCSLNKLNEDGIELLEILASDVNLEAEIILKEEIIILRKALFTLNPKELEIVDWFYFKQRSLKEYSEIKGLKKATAIKRKIRAIEKLKKYFSTSKVER